MLSRLAPARRRFWIGLVGVLVVAVLAVVVRGVSGGEPDVVPVAQDAQGPVLLVPGYGGSTASLSVLAAALAAQGRDTVLVRPPGGGTGDLLAQARKVASTAERLVAAGAPSVDAVGYSAGGVVVRLWVDQLGGGDLARRVVTLASPHHGTEVAGLAADLGSDACPTACEQLAPDSDLLTTLNADDETPPGPEWVAIWTTDDATVVPPTSGSLEGALDFSVQSVCPGLEVQHPEVPSTSAVVAMVERELGRGAPGLPDSSVCS